MMSGPMLSHSLQPSMENEEEDEYEYDDTDVGFDDGLSSSAKKASQDDDLIYNIDPVQCPICFTTATNSGSAIKLPCCHWFCTSCFQTYIQAQVGEGKAGKILCPMPAKECGKSLSQELLNEVLDSESQARMEYLRQSAFVLANPDYHHCPTPDCTNVVYWKPGTGSTGEAAIADCFKCNRVSCLKCGASPFHTSQTCEEHKETLLALRELRKRTFSSYTAQRPPLGQASQIEEVIEAFRLKRQRTNPVDRSRAGEERRFGFEVSSPPDEASFGDLNIKSCRRCGNGIELSDGCLKMKCRCGYRFCFQCGSENAQCNCTPSHHGFEDNLTGRADFAGLRDTESYT